MVLKKLFKTISHIIAFTMGTVAYSSPPAISHYTTPPPPPPWGAISIAGGVTFNEHQEARPLFLMNDYFENKEKWTPSSQVLLPVDFYPLGLPYIHGIAASAFKKKRSLSSFTAFGHYPTYQQRERALILNTFDNGSSWREPAITLATDAKITGNQSINSMQCLVEKNENSCIAGGYYESISSMHRPLILITEGDRTKWHPPSSIVFPTPFDGEGHISVIESSYGHVTQIAAGSYRTSGVQAPLVLISQDEGKNWQPAKFSLPPDFKGNGHIRAINCLYYNHQCVAVGAYSDGIKNNLPLILRSVDDGSSWEYVTPTLPKDMHEGTLSSVKCEIIQCTAIGNYLNSEGQMPLILWNDNNTKWAAPTSVALPSDFKKGTLTDLSCSVRRCDAVGHYQNQSDTTSKPLILTSSDRGESWSSLSPVLADDMKGKELQLMNVNCKYHTYPFYYRCQAFGSFVDSQGVEKPLILLRDNENAPWTSPNLLSLPADSKRAYLNVSAKVLHA